MALLQANLFEGNISIQGKGSEMRLKAAPCSPEGGRCLQVFSFWLAVALRFKAINILEWGEREVMGKALFLASKPAEAFEDPIWQLQCPRKGGGGGVAF